MKTMNGWINQKIKDICVIGRGRVISSDYIESHLGIYPVYSSQSVNNGEMGKIESYDFDGEFVTWTTDGANAGTVFYRNGKFNCTNVCGTLRSKDNHIDMKFLAYQLSTVAKKHVSYIGNPKLMNGIMSNIEIMIPEPKEEQSMIADILETVDQNIIQIEALIAKQERIKTGLMQDLLTKGIDEHGNIRSEDTHEFKDSLLGKIPVEWDVKRLDSISLKIADRDHTTPTYVEDGVLIISPMAFYDEEGIDFKKCPMITQKAHEVNRKKTDCMPGDLILHRIGAGLGRVRLVLNSHPKYSILHSLCMIRVNNELVSNSYLKWAFRSYELQKQISLGTQSIGVPDLGLDKIASLLFKIPLDIGEQKRIERILEENQRHTDDYLRQLRKLCSLKTGLMQDLLTGKKRVTPLLSETEVIS